MGWTFGWSSKEAVVDEISTGLQPHKLLKQSVRGNVVWQLVQINPREADLFQPYVTIWCVLLQNMEGEWGYKDIGIACGPMATGCPKTYLKAVTDPDESAKAWVEKELNPVVIEIGMRFNFGAEVYKVANPSMKIKGSAYNIMATSEQTGLTYRFKKSRVLSGLITTVPQE
jgi:hypothetical protein